MRKRARTVVNRASAVWAGLSGTLAGRIRLALLLCGGAFLSITVVAVGYTVSIHELAGALDEHANRAVRVAELERAVVDELAGAPASADRVDRVAFRASQSLDRLAAVVEDVERLRRAVRGERACAAVAALALRWLPAGAEFRPQCGEGAAAELFLARLRALELDELNDIVVQGGGLSGLADAAVRNVVTLVLVGLMLLFFLLWQFPGRLHQPLRRLSAVMHTAEGGRTDVVAPMVGLAELDDMARTLNSMLASFREFDVRKRARILQDRAKVGLLLERLPYAAALVDRGLVIDSANAAMRKLLQMGDGCVGRRLTEFLDGGSSGLERATSAVIEGREPGESALEVTLGKDRTHGTATLVPITGGRGTVEALLVELQTHRNPME